MESVIYMKWIKLYVHTTKEDFVFAMPLSEDNREAIKKDGTLRGKGELTQAEEEQVGYATILPRKWTVRLIKRLKKLEFQN